MHKKHMFLRVFSKIAIFACVFCAFFISPVFATLPTGYTELEYIADDINNGTKTVVIDTGIAGDNDNLEFEFDAYYDNYSQYGRFFGNYIADGASGWRIILYASDNNTSYFNANISCSGGDVFPIPKSQWNHITFNKTSATVNDDTYLVQRTVKASTNNANISLFSFLSVTTHRYIGLKLKYFIIRDNGTLVRNFIPAKRNSDNVVGMYDTVSQTFFTNAGTGDFIAGPIANCKTFGTDNVTCTACKSGYKLSNNGGCVEIIEIATTKFVDEEFAQAEANLAATVQTIESVVSRTIAQTGQIQVLQDTKQTRPDESCPANMKCLLVQDEDGTPHWYPIIEP